ncbi:MAG: efflux RND transporter periplasmic adaptor subunit [Thiomonas sp.]
MNHAVFPRSPGLRVVCASLCLLAHVCCPSAAIAAGPTIPLSAEQQTALGVRLAAVQPAKAAFIDLPARVTVPLAQQAIVSAPAAGLITRLLVSPGDTVKPGQVVAELSSPQIAQLQRERTEAQSRLELAQRQLQRDTLLVDEGIVPRARLDASRAQSREAQAMLAERELALKLAGAGAGLNGAAQLRAPAAGVVTEVSALPGQRLDTGAPLLRIAQQGQLWLELDASPQQAGAIAVGAEVEVPAQQARGVVQAKSPALSAGQTVMVRARLTQPGALQAGAVVQARIALPTPPGSWRVPPAAVTQIGGHDAVLLATDGGFRVVPVSIVARLNDAVIVRGALTSGARVAASSVVAIKAAAGEVAP